jgi:uncharacterized protein (DUF849 family)
MARPVIVELAVNGATPRHRNRHVPRTPAEITEAALAGIEAGASIVHNHNDEPMFTADGVHSVEPYLTAWRPVLDRHPDALLYPTMAAGAQGIPVTRRWAHVEELARRGMGGMTLVDPGSVNLGLASTGAVADDAAAGPYANPLADIGYMFARSGELGAAPSISVFEPGFLRAALAWQRRGRLPPGAMVKLYFGGELEFGLPPTATALEAYLELLEPSRLPWSVAVLGGDVVGCGLAELAIARGGHVRVGLEDYAGRASRPTWTCCAPRLPWPKVSGIHRPRSPRPARSSACRSAGRALEDVGGEGARGDAALAPVVQPGTHLLQPTAQRVDDGLLGSIGTVLDVVPDGAARVGQRAVPQPAAAGQFVHRGLHRRLRPGAGGGVGQQRHAEPALGEHVHLDRPEPGRVGHRDVRVAPGARGPGHTPTTGAGRDHRGGRARAAR